MRLALRELRRRPSRFLLAGTVLSLIAVLLMFLGGLLDGLVASSTGAYRAQQADLIVYSASAKESLVRSRIDPAVRQQVDQAVGADHVGGLGSVQLGARLPDRNERDLVSVALFGYEIAPSSAPQEPPAKGKVVADRSLESEGVAVGTELRLGPARTPVEVVGWIDDSQYSGVGTLWGSLDTWREVQNANRPGAVVADDVVQALVIDDGSARPAAVDRATDGATETLTIDEAIAAIPGVSAQQQTFGQIIGLTVVVAIVVVALFFALLTVERTALYGVLKALGARSRTIFAGVVVQAVLVALGAAVVGAVVSVAFALAVPAGSIPFALAPARVIASTVLLVVAAVIGCAFSVRRVLRADPASAIGGSP